MDPLFIYSQQQQQQQQQSIAENHSASSCFGRLSSFHRWFCWWFIGIFSAFYNILVHKSSMVRCTPSHVIFVIEPSLLERSLSPRIMCVCVCACKCCCCCCCHYYSTKNNFVLRFVTHHSLKYLGLIFIRSVCTLFLWRTI